MIQRKIVGEENANVPTTYSKLTKKQQTILKNIFGEEHRDVATGYYNLTNVYQEIWEYKEAIQNYTKIHLLARGKSTITAFNSLSPLLSFLSLCAFSSQEFLKLLSHLLHIKGRSQLLRTSWHSSGKVALPCESFSISNTFVRFLSRMCSSHSKYIYITFP